MLTLYTRYSTNTLRSQEAQEGAIDWSHRDPAVVDRFLSYLYTLDYDNMPPSSSIDSTVEEPNSAQHPGGEEEDEYSPQEPIGDLTDTGALLIARLSRLALNTDVYAMADEHQIPTLMQLAQLKFETDVRNLPLAALPDVISHVLDHTSPRDKGLREVCVKVCAEHIQEITGEDVGTAWDQLLRKDADFTFRVLHEGGHRLACQLESKSSELESKTAELERRSAAYKAVIALQPI